MSSQTDDLFESIRNCLDKVKRASTHSGRTRELGWALSDLEALERVVSALHVGPIVSNETNRLRGSVIESVIRDFEVAISESDDFEDEETSDVKLVSESIIRQAMETLRAIQPE